MKWVRDEAIALVTEFSSETAPKIFGTEVQAHLLLIGDKSDKVWMNLLPSKIIL